MQAFDKKKRLLEEETRVSPSFSGQAVSSAQKKKKNVDYSKNKFLVVSDCSWSFLNRSVLLFLSFPSILSYFQHSLCNIVMSC